MKRYRTPLLVFAATAIAAFCLGAKSQDGNRPPGVAEEKWVLVGKKAGFALTSDTAGSAVNAELYLKTEQGWRRVRLENPAGGSFLKE